MSSSAKTSTSNRQVMAKAAATAAAPPTASAAHPSKRAVDAVVRYVQATPHGEQAYQYVYPPPEGQKATNVERKEHTVSITDLRTVPQDFTLENNGFELHRLQIPSDIDWDDAQQVHSRYYPLVEKLLLKVTGGSRVHIFDHTLRLGKISQNEDFKPDQVGKRRQPVPSVHVDYTPTSGITRLDELLPEEADRLRETPFAVIQVWRPLRGPVQDSPLAMIDASTVAKEDFQESKLYFAGRTGTVYGVKHNPDHRFYYAKGITTEEAYVFVCYDSRDSRARFTPHTGFADPTVPADAPPRESVELRAYVFWEHEPKQPYAAQL